MAAAAKLPVVPLHALTPGQTVDTYALLAEKAPGTTREGKPYFACKFRDQQRYLAAMIWHDSGQFPACRDSWVVGQAYRLRVTCIEHERYGPQLDVHSARPATPADQSDGYQPETLVESSRFDTAVLFNELVAFAETAIQAGPLRRLTLGLLQRFAAPLQTLPASEGRFHPFRGGWLEHILSVCRTCQMLVNYYADHYAALGVGLDRDLLLTAAVLHDLGRAVEWKRGPIGVEPQPTVPGRLLGHLILGRDLVRDFARELGDVAADQLERLEHLILCHLVLPEWGSPRLPLLPEALILFHAKDLDAKLEMYLRCLNRDTGPGPFTARDAVLNKALLKPGPWPDERVCP